MGWNYLVAFRIPSTFHLNISFWEHKPHVFSLFMKLWVSRVHTSDSPTAGTVRQTSPCSRVHCIKRPDASTSPPFPRNFGYVCHPFPLLAPPLDRIAGRDAGKGVPCAKFACIRRCLWCGDGDKVGRVADITVGLFLKNIQSSVFFVSNALCERFPPLHSCFILLPYFCVCFFLLFLISCLILNKPLLLTFPQIALCAHWLTS